MTEPKYLLISSSKQMIRTHYKIQYCNVRQQKIGSHVSLDIIYLFQIQLCDIFIMPFHNVNDNYIFGYTSGRYVKVKC